MDAEWHLKISGHQLFLTLDDRSDPVENIEPSKNKTGVMEVYTSNQHLQLLLTKAKFDCAQTREYFEGKRKSRSLFYEAWLNLKDQLRQAAPQAGASEIPHTANMSADCNITNTSVESKMLESSSHESLQKHLFDEIIEVPISCLVEPSSSRLLRVAEECHVADLKEEMMSNKMKTALLIGHLPNVQRKDLNVHQLRSGNYCIEILAGNHRRIALQAIRKETSDQFYETWPVIIYAGLTEQQALSISYRENKMLNFARPTTLQDETILFRQRLLLITAVTTTIGRKEKERWYGDIRAITGYKTNSEINSKARIQTKLARSSEAVWNKLKTVFAMWDTSALKGSGKSTSIPQGVFKTFHKIPDEEKLTALDMLIAKEWTVGNFINKCKEINKKCAAADELADEDDTELEELKAVGQENTASPSDKMCHACTLHLAECERKEKQIQDLVISRRVVGRAEETSTNSSLGFCTVNCRPTASNYQDEQEQVTGAKPMKVFQKSQKLVEHQENGEKRNVNLERQKAGDLVVLKWGNDQMFLGLITSNGEVMSTRQSLSKHKREINEGVIPKGLLQLNPRDVNKANWDFLVTMMPPESFMIKETAISLTDEEKFIAELQTIIN